MLCLDCGAELEWDDLYDLRWCSYCSLERYFVSGQSSIAEKQILETERR